MDGLYGYTCSACIYIYGTRGCPQHRKEDKEKTMSVSERIKELTMPKDEKLMKKYEILNSCGELSTEGKDVVWSILLEEYKDKIVAQLELLEEEDKKKKKGKK